jgi:NAD+ synthase (glutamine-hydrolysing)
VGGQTDILFDGHSQVFNKEGEVVKELPYFEEEVAFVDLSEMSTNSSESSTSIEALIYKGLVTGIRDYFYKNGFEKAVIGLSGGIDSSVSTVLAAEALGADNVKVLLLPSQYSSEDSMTDGKALCENLGVEYETITIDAITQVYEKQLKPLFEGTSFGVAEENIQARARMVLLMAYSNKFGPILLNTSNKSEIAVGFGTLYGDLSGALSVLGDVYKTQVYDLAHYINQSETIIPNNVLEKPPSAELRPNQKDTDVLPSYEKLDEVLYQYIEKKKGRDDLIDMGFDEELVDSVRQRVDNSEHKRYQTGPVLRISPKAFGIGRRIPLVARFDF